MLAAGWPSATRVVVAALSLVTAAACVSPARPPVPIAGSADTRALDVRAEETRLRAADVLESDDLGDYLAAIVDRLLSADERSTEAPRIVVTVLRDPTLSAFALPTGRIFVHTGLLARLENEAQVALVFARELAHAVLRHEPVAAASEGAIDDALAGIAPAIARAMGAAPRADESTSDPLSPMARVILGSRLVVSYAAAVRGYGPVAARAADRDAVGRLQRAGYTLSEVPRTIERLRREARAGGVAERFFYGADAALAERLVVMAPLVATAEAPADVPTATDPSAFARRVAQVRRENASLELRAGRFRLAQEQLDHALAADPDDASTHLVYGDLARLRAQRSRSIADRDELVRSAVGSYERCLALEPARADVHLRLGLLYYQVRQLEAARAAFARYVTLAPAAPDAARVREYLVER